MNSKTSFEEKLQRINEIAEIMQNGQLTLDESVKLYKEACELSAECKKMLNEAELKIVTLSNSFMQPDTEDQ